jgi:Protein of unknown function (DUF3347)
MRPIIFFLSILLAGCNDAEKKPAPPVSQAQSKHSEAFNTSIENTLTAYDQLAEAFVQWDSVSIQRLAIELKQNLEKIDTTEGKGEPTRLETVKRELTTIEGNHSLNTRRQALNILSDHLFHYLNSVQYDKRELFLQECPMAFNDTEPGLWISGADTIRNPYLGLHHPKYNKGMVECGENKDRINYTGIESKDEKEK